MTFLAGLVIGAAIACIPCGLICRIYWQTANDLGAALVKHQAKARQMQQEIDDKVKENRNLAKLLRSPIYTRAIRSI